MSYIGWAITILAAGFGSYWGAFFRKKGENLATHEDIDKLVEQVSAVTIATKQIEARISNDLWARQKRWELKRELVFETTKLIARIDSALRSVNTAFEIDHAPDDPEWLTVAGEKAAHFLDSASELQAWGLLVATCCEPETIRATKDFAQFAEQLGSKIANGEAVYKSYVGEFSARANVVRKAFRKELGIDVQS